jgi:hypothetical protein
MVEYKSAPGKQWQMLTTLIPAIEKAEVGGLQSRLARQKCQTLSEKHTKSKRTEGMAQVVEHFPRKLTWP